MPRGKGQASLGCLFLKTSPVIRVEENWGKKRLRIDIIDGISQLTLPITDIRFYDNSHTEPDVAIVCKINKLFQLKNQEIILGVGVGREYQKSPDEQNVLVHWLQVNAIHLKVQFPWQLG